MRRLVALDMPSGPAFVTTLERVIDAGDAVLPVDQRLPKPAIAADPVPSDAPRNGTSASPAATTVQPVQSAAHQPTQVSPAPAQAQQRPVNGGSAATAQAATKQAANGKEDDEDWWTE